MVPLVGLEPTRLAATDFESASSTNSNTRAYIALSDSSAAASQGSHCNGLRIPEDRLSNPSSPQGENYYLIKP